MARSSGFGVRGSEFGVGAGFPRPEGRSEISLYYLLLITYYFITPSLPHLVVVPMTLPIKSYIKIQ